MKIREKKVITLATFSVVCLSLFFVVGLKFIESLHVEDRIYLSLSFLWFGVFIFLIYSSISYFLAPMFKTNYILDLLLKDTLHELNIPLSVIKANLQLLRLDEKNNSKIKRLDRISSACLDLNRLYRDMDYYIKREVLYDLKEEFDLEELVKNVVDKFKAMDIKADIKYNIKSLRLKADKHGFSKAISNLIDNSIKYNKDNNDIRVEVDGFKLVIADNGIGMDESEIFKVFNRYYQEDSAKKGFGIGLSIVKAYCDEEKIFIKIDSKKGDGTKVTLDLSQIVVE